MGFDINVSGILKEYNPEDIKIFVKDFFMIFSILEKLDSDIDNQSDKNIQKFRQMMKDWEKKYKDIVFVFKADNIQCTIIIYLKDGMENILGLIKQMSRFLELNYYKDKAEASFEDGEKINTLTLKEENGFVRLIYLKEDMLNSLSPEFRICAYYALKNGYDKSINLQKYADVFSFDASDIESNKWSRQYSNMKFVSKR